MPYVTATATCHTDGCPSAEVEVPDVCVEFDMDGETIYPAVQCGACGQPITDIDPPLDPGPDDPDPEPRDDQEDGQ